MIWKWRENVTSLFHLSFPSHTPIHYLLRGKIANYLIEFKVKSDLIKSFRKWSVGQPFLLAVALKVSVFLERGVTCMCW